MRNLGFGLLLIVCLFFLTGCAQPPPVIRMQESYPLLLPMDMAVRATTMYLG